MGCCFQIEAQSSNINASAGCQFLGETEFFDCGDQKYCQFHLPMRGALGQPTIKSNWKLSDLKRFFRALRSHAQKAVEEDREVKISGVVFPTGFKSTIIFGVGNPIPPIDFNGCIFTEKANFRGAVFEGLTKFEGAVFEGAADFCSAKFLDQANFQDASFMQRAKFNFAEFFYNANFERSEFKDVACFESASFGSWTFFSKTKFCVAHFDFATFNNCVFFKMAEFHGRASFQVRTEQNRKWNVQRGFANDDEVNRRLDKNFPMMDFNGAVFGDRISFSNRHFLEATDFSNAIFEYAPEFHNCVLHQDTDFTGTDFKDTESKHAARAYRILKLAMGDVRARNEEAMFYAKEQDSLRRKENTPLSNKIMSWVYMVLSDYGRSYVRPLLILTLITACFSFTYWFWEVRSGGVANAGNMFSFAMKQIVRPFSIWTANGIAQSEPIAIVTHYPLALRLVATVQSLLSISLVTLFLLAVRRQFRLG